MRAQEMITEEEVNQLLNNIMATLPDSEKQAIDTEATQRSNGGRLLYGKVVLRMNDNADGQAVWKVRAKLLDALKAKTIPFPPDAKVTLQMAPWKRDHNVAIGKMRGALGEHGVSQDTVKFMMGPPQTTMLAINGQRPTAIGTWDERRGWQLMATTELKKIKPDLEVEALMASYNDRA